MSILTDPPTTEDRNPRSPGTYRTRVYWGWDIGQQRDPTAGVMLERWVQRRWLATDERSEYERLELARARGLSAAAFTPHWRMVDRWYAVRYLDRLPLGTKYPAVVDTIARLAADPALNVMGEPPVVVLDATGVGRAILDLLEARGVRPVRPIIFTGGQVASYDRGCDYVPSKDLATTVQVLLQSGRLRIAEGLPLGEALAEELAEFRVEFNEQTGHAAFAAGRGSDDLVMALAVALWYAEQHQLYRADDFISGAGRR